MLEICLIFLYFYFKWKHSIDNTEYYNFPWKWLPYTNDLIQTKEVKDAVEKGYLWAVPYSMLIYTHLKFLLKDKTVVQIQIYGLGSHYREDFNGAGQLAVILKLYQKLKADFPHLSIISQDPETIEAEIEYQAQHGIQYYKGIYFSSNRFTDILKTENASRIKNPLMIFFALHLNHDQFEKFLEAHWDPKLLSQIIFISNSFSHLHHYAFCYARRAVEFSKFCKSIKLPVEPLPPKLEENPENYTKGDSTYFAFYGTNIHTITYENAKKLIDCCP